MLTKIFNHYFFKLVLPLLFGLTLLAGCGETTETASFDGEQQSKLYVSLTDAEGDFTQYKVDVTALKLYRSNGSIIETLPGTTTLDFSQYIEVTEFLSTATVPVGAYDKAEITLDYSSAELTVENASGESIPATALDENGDPLTTVTLTAEVNSGEGFVIRFGQPASLSLDFDLEASNEVSIDPSGTSATVKVNPILIANTSIDDDKTRRVRGLLNRVNTTENTFEVDIRPFRIRHRSHGVINVHVNDETLYEINGLKFSGITGLEALSRLDPLSPVIALGEFNYTERRFLGVEVYAGSSVPWGDKDALKGSIIARSENTLSVLGATIERKDGSYRFNDTIRVTVGDNTRVTKQGTNEAVTITDLSIGQRVMILGEIQQDGSMDASNAGIVRMRYSDVSGLVKSVSPLQLDLQHINRRNVARFNFSGTGIDPANNADPLEYEVATGTLSLNNLQDNSPVFVRGFPKPFASAPEDFTAKTIIDVGNVKTAMFMGYGLSGSETAVQRLDNNGLLLDLESTVGRHHLKQAGIITDINDLTSIPVITPSDGHALYALNRGRAVVVFTDWARFQENLSKALADGQKVIFVHAKGLYDSNLLTLQSQYLLIRLTSGPVSATLSQ